jgi:hypothetical protein
MTVANFPVQAVRPRLVFPVLVGGTIAGTFDLICAFLTYGIGVPKGIAGGLLGRGAINGGAGVYILGVFLHFFIAFSAALVYNLAGRRLEFMHPHFILCGLLFGMAFYLVMILVVLPLSALHSVAPRAIHDLIQGLLVHMILIGLPIAWAARRFSRS